MMSVAASFPSVKKPRFIDQEKERQRRLKVMRTGLVASTRAPLTILVDSSSARSNMEPAHNTTKYFVPNLR